MTGRTMRVVEITTEGSLVTARAPIPEPGPGQVLVRVEAAGVNRADLLQRRGLHPPPPGAPTAPGLEIAGEVIQLGPAASLRNSAATAPPLPRPTAALQEGEKVCALLDGGGYAEYALASAALTRQIPANMALPQAAVIPEAAATVWSNLVHDAGLHPTDNQGRTLLVQGGSGGVGTFAIQWGRATGAVVFATAGGPERVRGCEALGAHGIDYRQEDFVERVRAATGGANAILDVVGGAYLSRNLDALADHGSLAIIGLQKGATGTLPLLSLLTRWLRITGSVLRQRPLAQKVHILTEVFEHVWPLLERREIQPVVQTTMPLEEAARAHELLANSEVFGNVVLVP